MSSDRDPAAVRAPHIAINVLRNCHSSCCVELGQTRVICAISPPQQLIHEYRGKRGRIAVHVHHASNSINNSSNNNIYEYNSNNEEEQPSKTRSSNRDNKDNASLLPFLLSSSSAASSSFAAMGLDENVHNEDRAMALALEGVAEQVVNLCSIPQLLVEVFIEIINDDGGVIDAASLAMASALAHGQFEMKDMFAACSAGIMQRGGEIVTDLHRTAEIEASVLVQVVLTLTTNRIVYFTQRGSCEPATLMQLMETAMREVHSRKEFWLAQLRN